MEIKYRLHILTLIILSSVFFILPGFVFASLDSQITLQGKLTNTSDVVVSNGAQNMVFKIYTAPSSGSAVWTETWNTTTRFDSTVTGTAPSSGGISVTYTNDSSESNLTVGDTLYNNTTIDEVVIEAIDTTNNVITISPTSAAWTASDSLTNRISTRSGYFTARLGSITSLSSLNFGSNTYYLGITVGSDSEMTPRRRITGTTYSMDADKVDNFHAASSSVAAANQIPALDYTGYFVINQRIGVGTTSPWASLSVTASSTIANSFVVSDTNNLHKFLITAAGKIGISTSTPNAQLSIQGLGTNDLLNFWNTSGEQLLSINQYGGVTQSIGTTTARIIGGIQDASNLNGPFSVYVSGKYAYVVNYNDDSLRIIDIATTTPKIVGGLKDATNLNRAISVYVSGKYAYVANFDDDSLRIVDVSNPVSPSIVGGVKDAANLNSPQSVFVSGKYAYMANGDDASLRIIDISNSVGPSIVGGVQDTTNLSGAISVYVSGKYAYVVNYNDDSLRIIDISNSVSPSIVGGVKDAANLNSPQSVFVSGKYAYVANYNDDSLRIIDVSNPVSPSIVGGVKDASNLNGAYSVYVSGKYAYVANYNDTSLRIIDVSNPAIPSIVGGVKDASNLNPTSVFVSGKYAYVANYDGDSLRIIDIGGIDAPSAAIGNLEANYLSVTDNADFANNLYVRNGLNVGSGGIFTDSTSSAQYLLATQRAGIGTTSPFALLSVNAPVGMPSFAIGSSSNTHFLVDANGNVGVGSTSPWASLSIRAAANSAFPYFSIGSSTATSFIVDQNGRVGISTTTPYAMLTIQQNPSNLNLGIPGATTNLLSLTNPIGEPLLVADSYGGVTQSIGTTTARIIGGIQDNSNLNGADSVYVSGKYAYVANYADDSLRIIDIATTTPKIVGGIQDASNLNDPYSVYVSGKYAYVANILDSSLRIIDISNPASPSMVGGLKDASNLNGPDSVYVSGKYAYVANSSNDSLRIIDTSNPASPSIVGGLQDASNLNGAYSVHVSGKYAYVANCFDDSLRIIDISNPASPLMVGGLKDASNLNGANFIYVSGKYAYVANYDGDSLRIIDISNPASPSMVGGLKDASNLNGAYSVYISGEYAYVANYDDNSLRIIDIGGIDAPSAAIGNLEANYLSVTDNADFGNNLYVRNGLNVGQGGIFTDSTSTAPYILASNRVGVGTSSPFAYLSIQDGSTAMPKFVIGSSTGTALIVDSAGRIGIGTTSPTELFSVNGQIYVGGNGTSTFHNGINLLDGCFAIDGVCVGGGSGVVNTGLTGQFPYYAANGTTLTATSTLFLSTASRVGIGTTTPNARLSVQASSSVDDIFNLWNSSAQALLSINTYGGITQNIQSNTAYIKAGIRDATNLLGIYSVYVSGKYAYVANYNNDSLRIIDIATTSPQIIGGVSSSSNLNGAYSVFVSGQYAYVANQNDNSLRIIDVSNPTNPSIIGGIKDNTNLNYATFVYVSGQYAYVANQNDDSLRIIDVSNPVSPVIVGGIQDASNLNAISAVYVSGQYAYVANYNDDSLRIIDVSNPVSPAIVGGVKDTTNLDGAWSVYVSGKYAYVGNVTNNSLRIINISNPANPAIVGGVKDNTNLNAVYSVFVSGKYAYVAVNADDSLRIIDISNPTYPSIVGGVKDASNLNGAASVYVSGKYAYVANSLDSSLRIIDLGGLDIPTASIGNLETNYLSVTDNADFANNLYVRNGLNVGSGGIYTDSTSSAPYMLASNRMGVGTSSPFAYLSIQDGSTAMPKFVIGSSTGTALIVDSAGRIGIGTTSPTELFSVNGQIYVGGNGTSTFHNGINLLDGCFAIDGVCVGGGSGVVNTGLTGQFPYYAANGTTLTATSTLFLSTASRVGIGTTTPNARLSVQASSSVDDIFNAWNSSAQALLSINAYGGITQNIQSNTAYIKAGVKDTTNLDGPFSVYVSGKYAYVANNYSDSLRIIDIATTTPEIVGGLQDASNLNGATSVYVSGQYAYVANDNNDSLRIIDISNPASPTIVGGISDASNLNGTRSVYVSGQYAYVANYHSDSLRIINISNPASPTIVGGISDASNLNGPDSVYVSGQYAYVTAYDGDSFRIIDISNPASPSMVGGIQDASNLNAATSVYVSGQYAYVANYDGNSLIIINISNPASPTIVGSISDASNLNGATSVYVFGQYAYVANYNNDSFRIIDISNPASPTIVGGISDASNLNGTRSVYVSGKYAYVANILDDSLRIIDLGGLDIPAASIGNLEVNYLSVTDNADFANNLYVRNGLNVGPGGIYANGTSSFLALAIPNGAICADNGGTTKCYGSLVSGTVYGDASSFAASDIAENYYAEDEFLEPGDIVAIAGNSQFTINNLPNDGDISDILKNSIVKATTDNKQSIIGIVSSKPGVLLGDLTGYPDELKNKVRPVALSGRVPVKVSNENGDIAIGDKLTLSDTMPGVAVKMTESGQAIGVALEEFNELRITDYELGIGKILVFINFGYAKLETNSSLVNTLDFNGQGIENLASIMSVSGRWAIDEEGVLTVKKVATEEIRTKKLEMEDSATGNPYCVTIENGEWVKIIGECQ